jgi:heterodisulfide reductase subunit A
MGDVSLKKRRGNTMVKFKIDGIQVEIEEGKTILQAAQKYNIPIPTLCYHKALSPYGACRLCVVEINKAGRKIIQASCLYPVEDGVEVKTNTPELLNIRKMMIELIMARAPKSKKVREIAEKLGVFEASLIVKDEDCILCGLCVRMCQERMGKSVLSFSGRGDKRKVEPPFDVYSPVCMVCGACYSVCPTASEKLTRISAKDSKPILDEFDEHLRTRPVIHIPFPQAVPNLAVIDKDRCIHLLTDQCKVCTEFCEAQAIDFDQKEKTMDLNVGALVLACGFDEYDARAKSEYGYGRIKNVVTSIEFERILAASGPFQGHIMRPGDRREPKKIAFIQCVGSRDNEHKYCSSVCCTYAIKEAIIAKEHSKNGLDTAIFYMDIRTFGKGFEAYYERAKNEYGVRFVRAGVSKVNEDSNTKDLIVHYESEDGKRQEEAFDLVVLSIGLLPKQGIVQLAKKLKVNLNEYGFCRTSEFAPVDTLQDGIFVCGAISGPKDIPETVTQASGAAAQAMSLLAEARNTLITKKEYPPESDVSAQEPRIGIFICHCGINIGGYVDVPQVVEYAKTLNGVVYAEENLYTCSQDTQKKIVATIKEHTLNRVVVASCTPRTHEPLFRETIREAGLNPYLFEMANIRDQCSWIHMNEPVEATEKAKDLVRMAIAKTRLLTPLKRIEIKVIQKALVIGGGAAGMMASLSLADQGFEVFLVEKEKDLGGHLKHIFRTIEGRDVQDFLKRTVERVTTNKFIRLYTGATIKSIEGFIGNYSSLIVRANGKSEQVEHGVIVVATGAKEYAPHEYEYGKEAKVVTQREFEETLSFAINKGAGLNKDQRIRDLASDVARLQTVVMIQCVGSRDSEHPYCSRMCCTQAVKNALILLQEKPNVNVYILYKDVRTYGFKEDYYRKAREAGVVFIRYDDTCRPEVQREGDKLVIYVIDPILKMRVKIPSDMLVLSTGIEPLVDNPELAKMLKVPLNNEGFFLEAHVKLRPVDFATEGIFVAGMAHNPKTIDETICQAGAVAARAATIISSDTYYAEAAVSHVNEDLCCGCGVCSSLCPYEAIEIVTKDDQRKSKVNEALCKGCGTCVAACPSGALDQDGFTKKQILEMVKAFST